MIGQIVKGDQFVFLRGDEAGEVFLKLVVGLGREEAWPALHGKDDGNVNLRIGVGHAGKMSLRPELGKSLLPFLQRFRAYGAAAAGRVWSCLRLTGGRADRIFL